MTFTIDNDLMDMTFRERPDTSNKLVRISLTDMDNITPSPWFFDEVPIFDLSYDGQAWQAEHPEWESSDDAEWIEFPRIAVGPDELMYGFARREWFDYHEPQQVVMRVPIRTFSGKIAMFTLAGDYMIGAEAIGDHLRAMMLEPQPDELNVEELDDVDDAQANMNTFALAYESANSVGEEARNVSCRKHVRGLRSDLDEWMHRIGLPERDMA